MSNHNDRNIEAASQEAERLLAELEALAPAKRMQGAPPLPPPPPPKPSITQQASASSQPSRQSQMGLAWVLVLVLASMAGTLGIVSGLSTSRLGNSGSTSQQPSSLEPSKAGDLSTPKMQTEPYVPNNPSESTTQEPSGEALTQEQAITIIKGWLDAKSKVFAPPFTSQAVDSYVANGPLWNDITKAGGSIDWLKENDSYYSFASNTINSPISFSGVANEPAMIISVAQDMAFHSPKGTKQTTSTETYRYTFRLERGKWKIWDYKKQ